MNAGGRRLLPALILLGLLLPVSARGSERLLAPLAIRNQSPLVQIFGLPAAIDPSPPPAGAVQAGLRLDVASIFAADDNPREAILLDGEIYRATLALETGLPRGWSLGLEIPWVAHRQGFLDGFIEGWHDAFGLPQGGRDRAPRDRLLYRYVRDGVTQLELTEPTSGPGDVAFGCAWQAVKEEGPRAASLALGARLELPTGDSDRLLGSGSVDLALWLAGSRRAVLESGTLAAHLALGGLAMSRGDVLGDQQRPLAAFGRLGVAWSPAAWVGLKAQLDAHTPLYEGSDLDELGGAAALLTLGGTLALPGDLDLDLGIVEDVAVRTAPDVTFHFALNGRF